jgi:nitroreductase
MSVESLSVDKLLATTPAVRKRLDLSRPVPREVVEDCLRLALQAPTGGSRQTWHFIVVTDADKRQAIGEFYKRAWYAHNAARFRDYAPGDIRGERLDKLVDSARYLADHMHGVPLLLLACIEGRAENAAIARVAAQFASIIPAVWSFMLAARARHLGTVLTTAHLDYEADVAQLLGIPYEKVMQVALVPVAYFLGDDLKPSPRLPLEQVTHWDAW